MSSPRLRTGRAGRSAPAGRRGRLWWALASAVALCWALIPGSASATPVAGGAVTAGYGVRTCGFVQTGDLLMKLDVCTNYYAYPADYSPNYRFLVQLHSYKWAGQGGWVDSTSQSLTVNSTEVQVASPDRTGPYTNIVGWGQNVAADKCRHGSPDGPIGCSVPNAARMDFYSPLLKANIEMMAAWWRNVVFQVSWRDEYGHAHYWSPNLNSPSAYAQL